jgi:uncharacterized protein (UPF0128 family)
VRESSTLTGIKLHQQRCKKYHENIATLQALKKWGLDAIWNSKEGTKAASSHQRGESETMQMGDNVSVVMLSDPT